MSELNPYVAAFAAQRRAIEQSHKFAKQSVEGQKQGIEVFSESLDAAENVNGTSMEIQKAFFDTWIDAVESSVPGQERVFVHAREALDESFDAYEDVSDATWAAIAHSFDERSKAYDDLADEYLAFIEDTTESSVETLDEWESNTEDVAIDSSE